MNMNAIILYDSFSLALKANLLLQRASIKAGHLPGWNIVPWRTQLLRSQLFSKLALNEAADAELIVCAWSDSRPLNQWIADWLEQWISCRSSESSAIALLGENDDIHLTNIGAELSRFSENYGVSLIIGQGEVPGFVLPNPISDQIGRLHLT